jgi:hypothetical protein
MPVVYSHCLSRVYALPPGITALGTPLTGTKWVVKDIVVSNQGGDLDPLGSIRVYDDDQCDILSLGSGLAVTGYSFHWSGSQVIEYGQSLSVTTSHIGWSIRVSGYILTTP